MNSAKESRTIITTCDGMALGDKMENRMKKNCVRKLIALILATLMVIPMCACGKKVEEAPAPAVAESTEVDKTEEVQEVVEEEPEVKTKKIKRIASEEKSDGQVFTYEYDDNGNLVAKSLSDVDGFYKYEYNDKNLLVKEMQKDEYFSKPAFYEDMMGMTYDDLLAEAELDVSDDQMEMLNNGYTRYTDYEYDEKGNKVAEIEYVIDVYSFFFPMTYEVADSHRFEYNDDGSLAKIRWCSHHPEEPVWDYVLLYDDKGNNIGLQITASDDGKISREIEYVLDEEGNILSGFDLDIGEFHDCTYTYDEEGNVLTKTTEQYDFYEAFAEEKAFSYYNLDTYEYEDGLLVSHRYQMVPIGDVDPDYEFYVKDETTTYTYEEIEVEISDEEAENLEEAEKEKEENKEEGNEIQASFNTIAHPVHGSAEDGDVSELFFSISFCGKHFMDWNNPQEMMDYAKSKDRAAELVKYQDKKDDKTVDVYKVDITDGQFCSVEFEREGYEYRCGSAEYRASDGNDPDNGICVYMKKYNLKTPEDILEHLGFEPAKLIEDDYNGIDYNTSWGRVNVTKHTSGHNTSYAILSIEPDAIMNQIVLSMTDDALAVHAIYNAQLQR